MKRIINWIRFDYRNKRNTAPPTHEPVFIREDNYQDGVSVGFFDGLTWHDVHGSDDLKISWWASIDWPEDPGANPDGS